MVECRFGLWGVTGVAVRGLAGFSFERESDKGVSCMCVGVDFEVGIVGLQDK